MGQLKIDDKTNGAYYKLGVKAGKNEKETIEFAITDDNLPRHAHTVCVDGVSFDNGVIKDGRISGGKIVNGSCNVNVTLPKNATSNAGGLTQTPNDNCCLGVARTTSNTAVNIYSTNSPDISLRNNSVTATGTVTGDVTGKVTGTVMGTVWSSSYGSVKPNPFSLSIMQPYLVLNYIIALEGIYPTRP